MLRAGAADEALALETGAAELDVTARAAEAVAEVGGDVAEGVGAADPTEATVTTTRSNPTTVSNGIADAEGGALPR
ncbi:MAG: hypothetical protein JW751_16185 [Polyangiaceae bacterium]|nr:hypothetical protein [Polyangiaceae bacterium]